MIQNKSMIADTIDTSSKDNAPVADWTYHWDEVAQAPYLLNINSPQNNATSEDSTKAHMVTYDSPRSFREKAKKLAAYKDDAGNSLLGVKIWHVAGDTADGDLVKAFKEGWGEKA